MKKICMAVLGLVMVLLTGCTIKPEQVQVIAQNAGLFGAVGWIAADNPDRPTIEAVKVLLDVIKDKAADVEGGATYTLTVYPEVEKVIDSDKVPAQYRPAAKAATLTLLGTLDMLFATNPEWKQKQDVAIKVVDSFIVGAKLGLGLSEDHEVIKTARGMSASRAKVLK